jgi:Uma2 family endonuclease
MSTGISRSELARLYEESAQAYLRSLPLEHFRESTPQATQREITLESLAIVRARRPEVQVFNELLIQYPVAGQSDLGKVVPDNMIVVCEEPLGELSNYALPLQRVGPLCVMAYVSRSNRRKDYEDNLVRYERDLKVPYYLLFTPDIQEMILYHYHHDHYRTVLPNEQGRYAIPELELEVAILQRWLRFWFRGELLPLPGDLLRLLDDANARAEQAERSAEQARQQRDAERQVRERAEEELTRLRAELERLRGQSPEGQ